jgi:hypothetical protein
MKCSKSAEFPKFIRDAAWALDLKIDVETDETGFIFKKQTIRFKVSDESKEKVEKFVNTVHKAIDDYQQHMSSISGYGTSNVSGYGV